MDGFQSAPVIADGRDEQRKPEVEREWSKLPQGVRALLYRNAGLDPLRVPEGLAKLSQDERRKLQGANQRIAELQNTAARLLVAAVFFNPKG